MFHISKSLKTSQILICVFLVFSCGKNEQENLNPTVEIRYEEGRAQLFRHGEPYFIKGAGGTDQLEKVAMYGGNSIRTWSLYDVDRILDEAHKLGLTVTLGLEIGRPHWGKDFSYWRFWEVDQKIEELRPFIEKYKDHPALLMWGVGNEVTRYGGGGRLEILYIINKVAKMVKEVDPNHPTMTAVDFLSGKTKIGSIEKIIPNIDILGYNIFKSPLDIHDAMYKNNGWSKAYIISEWGPTGHWSIPNSEWGAPIELKNSTKRELMEKHWNLMNNDSVFFLGSYAFYWGFKHEATHTWFSLFSSDGSETESVNFLRYAWSGENTKNLAPIVENLFIETKEGLVSDNVYLANYQDYTAVATVDDPEGDALTYKWEIRHEENYFIDEINKTDVKLNYYNMKYLIQKVEDNKIQFKSPKEEGPYRIFVFAYDGQGNVASYNIPFYVFMK
ncbi:hypothetical protein M3O96_16860 [Aquiflexum sp. TKW24L]|uniref:glycoside hydrolase family 2 TIM barrel-domain containing protein n=1 Tax=Aquiflexum sp. TKW24L TaxID=2942212 RepID=UPI0020BEE986|nr:glycoside hydrolase family 2 TIM barrel-domain containing protein [Aquiflexum sp. TKW24L]MCL6260775.1 hypothetical protein [Aquiflexum sp. TKW24L]